MFDRKVLIFLCPVLLCGALALGLVQKVMLAFNASVVGIVTWLSGAFAGVSCGMLLLLAVGTWQLIRWRFRS